LSKRNPPLKVAIARATNVGDVKNIRDKAEALRVYAKQAGIGLEVQNAVAEIKLRAERKAGELLEEIEREQGKRTDLTSGHDVSKLQQLATDLETDLKQLSRWQQESRYHYDRHKIT